MPFGINLDLYKADLNRVPVNFNYNPLKSFDLEKAMGSACVEYARLYIDEQFELKEKVHNIPVLALKNLNVDQISKIFVSSRIILDGQVENLFEEQDEFILVRKIKSSIWRWGYRRCAWNEVVDIYDAIRGFKFEKEDFSIKLDYTTGHNECGTSQHSRTFLDGVFSFIVYYKNKHVMTIGFSFSSGYKLLLQQVQLKQAKGNRWLYKFPKNYVEYVVELFKANFKKHQIYIVDGEDLSNKSLKSYKTSLREVKEVIETVELSLKHSDLNKDYHVKRLKAYYDDAVFFKEKIAHLESQVDRLKNLYYNTGRYKQGKLLKLNGLRHYELKEQYALDNTNT